MTTIKTFQVNRGLSKEMLTDCVTLKILLNGDQPEKEQQDIISWYHDRIAEDNTAMPNSP